jgi:hypothetical protein
MPKGTTATTASKSSAGHQPVWFNLLRAAVEIGGGIYCIGSQFNTTRDTIFGLMQAGTQIPTKMTAQQLLAFLNGNADKLNGIAFTIALVTQIVFWWAALPETRNAHKSKLRRAVAVLLLVLEVGSDLQYASGTNTLIGGDLTRIFTTGGYSWVGIILFALCLAYGSTFVFLNGIRVLGNVIEGNPD